MREPQLVFEVGKRVVAESESADRQPRRGVIEEVLRGDPSPRYRIRWDDGHESIYTPASGALRARQRHRASKPAGSRRHSSQASDEPAAAPKSADAERRTAASGAEPNELALYYRDEDGHIHVLE
jgi:hypothetical protein